MERIFKDPNADARSPMMERPVMCNGQATGFECKHYWAVVCKMDAANSDNLKEGERMRRCLLTVTQQYIDLIDLPTRCNQYVASDRPYDPAFDVYDPLTDEEVTHLRAEWAKRHADNTPFSAAEVIKQFRNDMEAK
jgi:hypothetical protein